MKSNRGVSLPAVVAWCVLVLVGASALSYVFSPVPPYGFYYDLGGNILATSVIAHWIAGFADLWDSMGWAGWGDRTAFAYAPMTIYAFTVPIAKMFGGNGFAAVKAMQVFDLAVAWAAGSYLYVVLRGRSPWAWVAGFVYALLPQQMLMIRGNVEFGLAAAVAPLAFAWPIALLRRYGALALPLCGAVAALASTYLAVEYAIFVGIPAYLLAVAVAYDRSNRLRWGALAVTGFVAFLAASAYTALPTLASHASFAPPAAAEALRQGGEFAVFAEGPVALLSLCLNEFLANQRPEFSIESVLGLTVPVGLVLWGLAIGWVVRCVRARAFAPGERAVVVAGAICLVISTGGAIPGIGLIWWAAAHLPGLDMVRTPDRFVELLVPVVVVAAVSSLEMLARAQRTRLVAYAVTGALALASLALFFSLRTLLGDTLTLEDRQPHFDAINAVVEARGNRVANLALVKAGSVFDTSLYGMNVPGLDFGGDFTERYESDGLGGTGMLARANVATVVAAPGWAADSPLLAQSAVARATFLHPLEGDATTVAAYGVEPVRGFVHSVALACIYGGPGMLDYLVSAPVFASTAFVPNGTDCARTLYANAAPPGSVLGGTIVASIAGTAMFPAAGVLRDIDYRIAFGQFLLALPWYRNAIEGDSPEIGSGAVSLDSGEAGVAPFDLARPGDYALGVRAACHATVNATVRVDDGPKLPLTCPPARGFAWTRVALGHLKAGPHRLALDVGAFDTSSPIASSTWHFGVDGAVVVDVGAVAPLPSGAAAFAFSAARLASEISSRPPATLTLAATRGFDLIPGSDAAHAMLLARTSDALATYRFSGPPGRYRVTASAYVDAFESGGSYLGILDGSRCCAAVASSNRDRGTTAYAEGFLVLRDGDPVRAVIHSTANDPGSIAQLLSIGIEPDPKPAEPDPERSHYGAWFEFTQTAKRLNPEVPNGPTPVPGHVALTPFVGLPLWQKPLEFSAADFPRETWSSPTSFEASLAGDGTVEVRLSCGAAATTARLNAPGGEVSLPATAVANCSVTLSSQSANLYVQSVSITRAIASLDLVGDRWMAAGTYRVELIRRGGSAAPGSVSVDGTPVRETISLARSGLHAIRWARAPADAYLIAFVPTAWPTAPPPISVTQDASQRWTVRVAQPATLEGAVFSDGFWRLTGSGGAIDGTSCDLENTCFSTVPPGEYRLWHAWPGYTMLGFAVTLFAWVGAGGLLLTAKRKKSS